MRNAGTFALAALTALGVSFGARLLEDPRPAVNASPEGLVRRLVPARASAGAAETEVAALRQEVAHLREQLQQRTGAAATPVSNGSASPVGTAGGTLVDNQALYNQHLHDTFHDEAPDPHWDGKERVTNLVVSRLAAGSRLRSLECRSTMCRVETEHADMPSLGKFQRGLALNRDDMSGWRGSVLHDVEDSDEAPFVSVAYLVREGHEAPVLWLAPN